MAVIFGEDALLEQTIDKLFTYIEDVKKKFLWGSNVYLWSPQLTITNGVVLTHQLPENMAQVIMFELAARNKLPYLPENAVVMFYSWQPGSNITWHTDYDNKNSMTIYLSKDWNPDHGGYFCWKDWDESFPKGESAHPPEECKMKLPKYNHYVFMTGAEWHSTTIMAPSAPPRLSLQMFFKKP